MADFQLRRARDLDLGLGHTAYHRASLIDLYPHAKISPKSKKLFVDTNQRMDRFTDRHSRAALLA